MTTIAFYLSLNYSYFHIFPLWLVKPFISVYLCIQINFFPLKNLPSKLILRQIYSSAFKKYNGLMSLHFASWLLQASKTSNRRQICTGVFVQIQCRFRSSAASRFISIQNLTNWWNLSWIFMSMCFLDANFCY